MLPLDFDDSVFHSTAGATAGFQLFGQRLQLFPSQGHTGDHRDPLSLSAFGLSGDTDDAVAFCGLAAVASTVTDGFSAGGTGSACIRGVNQTAVAVSFPLQCLLAADFP